jgi:hypothetical protein
LDLDTTVRFGFDGVPHLAEPFVERAPGGLVVELAKLKFGSAKASRQDERSCGYSDAAREFSARDFVCHCVSGGVHPPKGQRLKPSQYYTLSARLKPACRQAGRFPQTF